VSDRYRLTGVDLHVPLTTARRSSGTLDLLILKTLSSGTFHGWASATQATRATLKIEEGSPGLALHDAVKG
jgi:hypothetical protein